MMQSSTSPRRPGSHQSSPRGDGKHLVSDAAFFLLAIPYTLILFWLLALLVSFIVNGALNLFAMAAPPTIICQLVQCISYHDALEIGVPEAIAIHEEMTAEELLATHTPDHNSTWSVSCPTYTTYRPTQANLLYSNTEAGDDHIPDTTIPNGADFAGAGLFGSYALERGNQPHLTRRRQLP